MSGYSDGVAKTDEQVAQLLSERPDGWEYLLYGGMMCAGVERLETKYADYTIGYAPRLGSIVQRSDFHHFVMSQLSEIEIMIHHLNVFLNDAQIREDAFGAPGDPGDPDKIMHAAWRVVRVYEDMLKWAERVRGMAMPSKFREVTELLTQYPGESIDAFRDFVHRLAAQVEEIPTRLKRDEDIVIEVRVSFKIKEGLSEKFLEKLSTLIADEQRSVRR